MGDCGAIGANVPRRSCCFATGETCIKVCALTGGECLCGPVAYVKCNEKLGIWCVDCLCNGPDKKKVAQWRVNTYFVCCGGESAAWKAFLYCSAVVVLFILSLKSSTEHGPSVTNTIMGLCVVPFAYLACMECAMVGEAADNKKRRGGDFIPRDKYVVAVDAAAETSLTDPLNPPPVYSESEPNTHKAVPPLYDTE
jgi:hypothetical protein